MLSNEVVIQCSPRQREADNNNFVDNWWHKYTRQLWSLLGVAGDVPRPKDDWNETSHLSKATETNAESGGKSQTYSHSSGTLQVVTPVCEKIQRLPRIGTVVKNNLRQLRIGTQQCIVSVRKSS